MFVRIFIGRSVIRNTSNRPTIFSELKPLLNVGHKTTKNIFIYNCFHISNTTEEQSKNTKPGSTDNKKKSEKSISPKITLIGTDDQISVVSLEEGQKIAKRRELKLVQVQDFDVKSKRPIYKLLSGKDFFNESLKERQAKKESKTSVNIKGAKLITISCRIEKHDLESRFKQIRKWLAKSVEARIIITGEGENSTKAEDVYKTIESELKEDGRFIQKRTKGSEIRFQILPQRKTQQQTTEEVKDVEEVKNT